MLVALLGVSGLAVLAIFEESVVMFVSAGAIGIIVYVFRRARTRDRDIGIVAAGLGGSIGAEIVLTIYHYASVTEPATGNGEIFLSAILVGLVNAGAIIVLLFVTEAALKIIDRKAR